MRYSYLRILSLAIVLVIPLSADADVNERSTQKPSPDLAARLFQLPDGVELDEEQKTKVAALVVEYEPKLALYQKKIAEILTKEQRHAKRPKVSRV